MSRQDSPTTAEQRLEQTILNEWLVHDEECASSLLDEPCDCIQKNVEKNIMPLIELYGNSRELEGLKHVVTKYNYSGDEITGVKYEYDDGSEVDLDTRIKQLESQKETKDD